MSGDYTTNTYGARCHAATSETCKTPMENLKYTA